MNQIYTLLLFFILNTFSSCSSKSNFSDLFIDDKQAIRNNIEGFFNGYNGNYRQADTSYVSSNLKNATAKAIAEEKASALEVMASRYPSDKPKILEGDVFSGLYEGYTAFSIRDIKMLNDTLASSEILFANHYYNNKWTDSIVLVYENGWKISNIYFIKPNHKPALSALQLLDSFIVSK